MVDRTVTAAGVLLQAKYQNVSHAQRHTDSGGVDLGKTERRGGKGGWGEMTRAIQVMTAEDQASGSHRKAKRNAEPTSAAVKK